MAGVTLFQASRTSKEKLLQLLFYLHLSILDNMRIHILHSNKHPLYFDLYD